MIILRIAVLVVTLVGLSVPAFAAAPSQKVCDKAIQSLTKEWKTVGYQTPSKPTAMRVVGKNGHENTAAQIAYMKDQIKSAQDDCAAGKDQAALNRIGTVTALMNTRGWSGETANAAIEPEPTK
jgi:hypothetical protein